MFDIKWIRENAEAFDAGLKNRKLEPQSAKLLELDDARRRHLTKLQDAQSKRNSASKDIGKAKAQKDEALAQKLMGEVAELKDVIQSGEEEERKLIAALEEALAVIPNTPRGDVPVGADETDNVEVRRVGAPPKLDFTPKQHFEIGEALGLMDFETAGKVSGARFVFLKGALARLERAIGNFMLDLHTGEFGYSETNPPLLVRDDAAFGTGNLPKFENDLFRVDAVDWEKVQKAAEDNAGRVTWRIRKRYRDNKVFESIPKDLPIEEFRRVLDELTAPHMAAAVEEVGSEIRRDISKGKFSDRYYLIPTAEVSLTNMVREEILDEDTLPKRLTAWTPCFRSEAGAAGRDTRGMIRQHQFAKVELVSVTTPEESEAEHERMTACAEEVLKRLGLAYRTVLLCTGDMGFASQKTYDIEVWLPGQDAYREISSCSVCGDFQARRMNARYRAKGTKELRFVHTLNGSGLAVGRTLVAVLENYQQADGSVIIPEALQPYMGGLKRIERPAEA